MPDGLGITVMEKMDASDQGVDADGQTLSRRNLEQGAVVPDAEEHIPTRRSEIGEETSDQIKLRPRHA
jgi:hypothetical protein